MKKACLIGFIAAIALMACSAIVNAEISPVANGNFEYDACTNGYDLAAPFTDWTASGGIQLTCEPWSGGGYGTVGADNGPGASDVNWLCLWQSAAQAYQDLGTTETTGFYVAQAFMQRHLTTGYDITPFEFSLVDAGTSTKLASTGLTELYWVVPGAADRSLTPPVLLAEVTFQATSAIPLRVQVDSIPVGYLARIGVDDIRVVNELLGAHNPSPARRAVDVPSSSALSWTTGITSNIDGHNVYLGTDPENLVLQNATPLAAGTTTYDPDIANDTIYYWRVDELVGTETITGTIWAFRTELSLPVITEEPASVGGFPGEDVTLTVVATNPVAGTLSYQWYRDPNTALPGDQVALTNGADYSGVDTATLTVLDLEEADNGKDFFCAVSNVAGSVNTETVEVFVGQMVHYWPFDSDFNDAKGNATLATAYGDPDYETGVVGQALSLDDGTDTTYDGLEFANVSPFFDPDTFEPVIYEGGSSTISFWVKSHDITKDWAGFFSRTAINSLWIGQHSTEGMLRFRGIQLMANATYWFDVDWSTTLVQDEWYFLALRMDQGGTALFINGVPFMKMVFPGSLMTYDAALFRIGMINWADQTSPDGWLHGAIDEFKIYNYPLTDRQIAQEYANSIGTPVCVQDNPANIVEEGNCAVDLADFAALAASWLQDLNVYDQNP